MALTTIGITGHQHIPPAGREYIATGIRRVLADAGAAAVGVGCLAAGADQLFAELLLCEGLRLDTVVPCQGYEAAFANDAERAGFRRLLRLAHSVETLDFAAPSQEAFMAGGRRVVQRCDLLVAVWDGQPARGLGGTGDVVAYARRVERPVEVIWPPGVRRP